MTISGTTHLYLLTTFKFDSISRATGSDSLLMSRLQKNEQGPWHLSYPITVSVSG